MEKKISIIIPCYKVEQYIDRCMNSLINQTIGIENLELIFVNDASPDHTLDKLLDYEKQYPDSIMVINSEENMKQGGARNLGLHYASADYIGFVDSDDWVELTMFEKLYMKAIAYDCDIVTCECKRVFTEGSPMGPTGKQDSFFIIDDVLSRKDLIISGMGSGGVWSKLYKKDLIVHNDIFFPEHLTYEDNFFTSFIMMYVTRIYFLEEYLYHYFVNMNSTIVTTSSMHHFDRLTIELMKLEEYKYRDLYDTYLQEIEFNFLLLYYLNTLHIIFTRFKEIPSKQLIQMQQCVLENFPDYHLNPYVNKFFGDTYKELLKTIKLSLSHEHWQTIGEAYQKKANVTI